jgi:hypothetical protein
MPIIAILEDDAPLGLTGPHGWACLLLLLKANLPMVRIAMQSSCAGSRW